ncbi:iron complex transport system permease protein [Haloplanus vescus]|uniref:Cobalamin import system permease protein BtuC n=1 Tax=Haloplanus vescus TaxID=555874 RepID=A0A1H3WB14_9EURY|nr:vitamin B12 ABC transporter permease BtuC [Haloplanus vescus]SDZ84265.1 iron complex transport system permease protein [Haloplanus vescus]
MRTSVRTGAWVGGLLGALVAVTLASATIGPVEIGARSVAEIALAAALGGTATAPESHRTIIMSIRLPRIALGAVVGFALASAGTVMQGFFRNPMADPSIVGISAGAATGAVAAIVAPVAVPVALPVAAFVGALVAAFGVYALASEGGRTPVQTLLLAGIAVQTFLGAAVSFMLVSAGRDLREAIYWLMGHLHHSTWTEATVAAAVVLPGFLGLLAYARDLNVLLLGEEDAHSLGIEVERTKRLLLTVSSLLTAAAVAVAGVIGFVGLVVPHVMRLLVGPDHRILLPTSALAGAAFLVATDTVARAGAAELPVGIVTAAVGAPFFLYLLRKREVHAP